MNMSFGRYEGKPVAWVLLEDFQYFTWMDSNGMREYQEIKFAIQLACAFDKLPFKNVICRGTCNGQNPVTRLALYNGMYNGEHWFCDKCDPYRNGAFSGTLTYINKVEEVVGCGKDLQIIIKAMANAKGVPRRKTSRSLKIFFGY